MKGEKIAKITHFCNIYITTTSVRVLNPLDKKTTQKNFIKINLFSYPAQCLVYKMYSILSTERVINKSVVEFNYLHIMFGNPLTSTVSTHLLGH